jgi:hypothetical protein
MKRKKVITTKLDDREVEIIVKTKTKGLTRDESKVMISSIASRIMNAIPGAYLNVHLSDLLVK